jgi:hypothetical protein
MTLIPSLLLLASAQVSALDPLPAESHLFKDWIVACDNGLTCRAVSLVPEPSPAELEAAQMTVGTPQQPAVDPWERFGVLRLERDAGADAPLRLLLTDFDGTPARLTMHGDVLEARITQVEEGWRVEPANQAAFLDALYSGTLSVQDASGRTLSEIALDGSRGALVYMDERQGRLGTPSAAIRRGRRPNSSVPPAPPLPVVQVAPRTSERPLAIPAARMAAARREMGCTVEEVGASAQETTSFALGNGRTLIMMGCGSGAYNVNHLPLIAWREGGAIRIAAAPFDVSHDPIEGEPEPKGYFVTNAEFDPAGMTISHWAKGRGIGDCGTSASYAWDGQRFRLVEQNEMSECRGTLERLVTWRAATR